MRRLIVVLVVLVTITAVLGARRNAEVWHSLPDEGPIRPADREKGP